MDRWYGITLRDENNNLVGQTGIEGQTALSALENALDRGHLCMPPGQVMHAFVNRPDGVVFSFETKQL